MEPLHPKLVLSEQEFSCLFVKHEPVLRAFARRMVPDWQLVDEAIQEASITMWQKRSQLESDDGFLPWAKVVVRFKCFRQLEKLRSRRTVLSFATVELLVDNESQQPLSAMHDRAPALRACLQQFSREHQELLFTPHKSTESIAELAVRRNKTANALYKLLARLRAQLASCIELRIATEVD